LADPRRYALCVEYDGTDFVGWQRQTGLRSVQGVLEQALSIVADAPLDVVAAGRTDAGVHASGQVVHFDTARERPARAWVRGTNANLPPDVAVRWVRPVADDFHARFGATGRRYRYVVCDRRSRPALERRHVCWTRREVDLARMQRAAEPLLGRHDFSAYRASQCQARSPVRTLRRLDVARAGEMITFRVEADAFLHHMVRNLVGSLLRVGRGDADEQWPARVLETGDRRLAGATAPAAGLTLTGVAYPERYGLPEPDCPGRATCDGGVGL